MRLMMFALTFLIVCSVPAKAQTAEETVLLLLGEETDEFTKVTRLSNCVYQINNRGPQFEGEYAIFDFSKMREYSPRQFSEKLYVIRMAGTNDFIFHRFKGPKSEGGGMREEYRHELSQEILGTRSTQKLKAAEAYFRSTICKSP